MSPRTLTIAAGVVAVILLFLVAGGQVGPLELGVVIVFFSVIAALVGGRGGVLRFETSATPQQVVNAAITNVGTHRRWATLSHTDTGVTFGYHRPPSKLIAFILLLCFIVPGIVYLVLAGKKESLSVTTTRGEERTVVQATANGWRGRGASRELERQLAVVVTPAVPEPSPQVAGDG